MMVLNVFAVIFLIKSLIISIVIAYLSIKDSITFPFIFFLFVF